MTEHHASGPVVVGIDGSDSGFHALESAAHAAACRGAELHVVHVNDVTPAVLHLPHDVKVTTRDLAEERREELWASARQILDGGPVSYELVGLEGSHSADTLISYCGEVDAQLLVVGPRGRGRITRAVLGSTAHNVVNHSVCDVLVVRPET